MHLASAAPTATPVSYSHSVFAKLPGVDGLAPSSQMVYATSDFNCTQVWAITPWGQVELYATLPIPLASCGEGGIVVAPSTCGCGAEIVYVVQEGKVFEITNWPTTVTLLATVTTSHINQDMSITYDQVGLFHHELIVTGSSQSDIWLVNQWTGAVTLLTSLGTHQVEGPSIAPIGFGNYGGDLIVPLQLTNQVVAVDPDGASTFILDYPMGESVAFANNCNVGLLVANQTAGGIDLYPLSELTGLTHDGFVNGEGDKGIAAFGPDGSTTTIAFDTHHTEQIAFL